MIYTLKNIGAHSAGKTYGGAMGIFALIVSVPFSLFSIFTDSAAMGVAMLLLLPLIYFVIGYLAGGLFAIIYNFTARKVGGVEIELQEK